MFTLNYSIVLYKYCIQECPGLTIRLVSIEDVDPSVGRFRNMIQTSFIPSSKVSLLYIR